MPTVGGLGFLIHAQSSINGQLVIGSIAGVTANGSSAGDVDVTTYDFATQGINTSVLHPQLNQDDHADPAFAPLPDGRVLVTYQTHGNDNNVLWRVGSFTGATLTWGAEQTSVVNITNDGNGNTYSNPFYLSTPNQVVSFSRAIGYDPNYSIFTNLGNPTPTFSYGGHWMYWKNPNNQTLTGGNGRPYVKYASNGADTIWFATTEDSPQNYPNSLYSGFIRFSSAGVGTVFTSTGTALGGLSTGTPPTTATNNGAGSLPSGSGNSYLPTQFTPIVKANQNFNGVNLTGKYVGWASSMQLDNNGNPYLGFVVVDNLNGAYGNDLEYYYAHFDGAAWQVARVGFAGLPLYNGQNQYAGLITVDPLDPNKVFVSDDVNPTTNATLLGPDGHQHWQIFQGLTSDKGNSWNWTQLTNTSSDNIRPLAAAGSGEEALLWMQGTYSAYTDYATSVVGLIQNVPEPSSLNLVIASGFVVCIWMKNHRQSHMAIAQAACRTSREALTLFIRHDSEILLEPQVSMIFRFTSHENHCRTLSQTQPYRDRQNRGRRFELPQRERITGAPSCTRLADAQFRFRSTHWLRCWW